MWVCDCPYRVSVLVAKKTTDISQVNDVISVIRNIDESESTDDLFAILQDYTRHYGFISLTIGLIVNPANAKRPLQTFGKSDLPQDFQDLWFSENLMIHDPIVGYALQSDGAFLWSEAVRHATRFGQKLHDTHAKLTAFDGLAVATKVKGYPKGLFSMAHPNPVDFKLVELAKIELICIHVYTHLLQLTAASVEQRYTKLTKREVDILHYVTAGKTNWEISKIYDISVGAVKKHMQNIQRKLEASNRTHASALGIKSGQIIP